MPAPIGYAEITHHFTGVGVPLGAAITYGVENELPRTATALAQLCHDTFGADMKTSYGSEVNMVRTECKLGPPDTGASSEWSTPSYGGLLTGVATSPNVAFLFVKGTALGGRRGKGRFYLPGVTEASVDQGGNVLAATVTTQQGDLSSWLANLTTAQAPMVVFHGPTHIWILVDGKPKQVPDVPFAGPPSLVTSLTATTKVATQRRRLR